MLNDPQSPRMVHVSKNKFTPVKALSKAAKAKAKADAQRALRRAMEAELHQSKRQSRPRSGSPVLVNMTELVAADNKKGNKPNKMTNFVKAAAKQGTAQRKKTAARTPQAGSQLALAELLKKGKNKPAAVLKPETTLPTAQAASKPAPGKTRKPETAPPTSPVASKSAQVKALKLGRVMRLQRAGSPSYAEVASNHAVSPSRPSPPAHLPPNPVTAPNTTARRPKTPGKVKLVIREDEHGNLMEEVRVVKVATGQVIDLTADSDTEEEEPAADSQKKTVATRVLAEAMRGIFGAGVTVNRAESIQIDGLTLVAKPKLGAAGWAFIDLLAEHARIEPASTGRSGPAPSSPLPRPV